MTFGEKMLFLAGILFCMVLITTAMMGGLFARYVSTESGSDSARVATFGNLTLEETGDFTGQKGMIIPGVDLKKQARVSFESSEVATVIFVEIKAPDWTPRDDKKGFFVGDPANPYLQWSVADGWDYLDDTDYVYYRILNPNTLLNKAEIIAPIGETDTHIQVSDAITEAVMANLKTKDLTITLQASVIQSGGFDTVEAAWDYLNP